MKRNLLIAFILAGLVTSLSGQDRIITLNNDTIACRISRVTRSDIYFDVITQGVTTTGKMSIADILSYRVSPAQEIGQEYKAVRSGSAGRLRFGLNGGMGYITSSSGAAEEAMVSLGVTEQKARSYYRNLKTGWYGSADATWLFHNRYGAGLKYKFFNTNASMESYFDTGDGINIFYSDYRENIFVNYAGVSIFYHEPIGKGGNLSLYSSYSLGVAFYRNESETFYGNFLITGKAFGIDGSLGLEYHITPLLSAGAELSFFTATIRKITITDGEMTETMDLENENFENLSRAEASIGIRFYFGNR
jgi:hypothetical protein